jgi:anaphase-promoting complex subunit 10
VYLSHKKDDSYTPEKMSIRAGTSLRDLQDVREVRFEKPEGWIEFTVSSEDNNQKDLELNGGNTYALYLPVPN